MRAKRTLHTFLSVIYTYLRYYTNTESRTQKGERGAAQRRHAHAEPTERAQAARTERAAKYATTCGECRIVGNHAHTHAIRYLQ